MPAPAGAFALTYARAINQELSVHTTPDPDIPPREPEVPPPEPPPGPPQPVEDPPPGDMPPPPPQRAGARGKGAIKCPASSGKAPLPSASSTSPSSCDPRRAASRWTWTC
ncbi:hypothetical protein CBM2587_B90504 [Cupriavidus taiwanensis]|uniref:Uncharacterized protein n=1 Tax=Cupriavidus taiwanensis TaxID=164546 RepID=A0A375CDB8_9BURK|nr:hypothetical protein CBM2587_B90504 [Cupriavidus taiwanensis]